VLEHTCIPGQPRRAKTEVALAGDLNTEFGATAAAPAAGRITREQAAAIAAGMRALPRRLDPRLRDEAETFPLEQADTFEPAALRKLARHLTVTLDPESAAELETEGVEAVDRQELTLATEPTAAGICAAASTPRAGALLHAALDAVSAPRPGPDGERDPRSAAQRRAEGLLDLIRPALATGEIHDFGRLSRTVPRPIRRPIHRALVARDGGGAFPGCGRPPRWCHAHHIWHPHGRHGRVGQQRGVRHDSHARQGVGHNPGERKSFIHKAIAGSRAGREVSL